MKRVRSLTTAGAVVVLLAGCQNTDSTAPARIARPDGAAMNVSEASGTYSPELDHIRQQIAASGVRNVELVSAEISVAGDSAGWQGATTLYANDRTHTLSSAFVARDPRRGGSADISYIVDQSNEFALSRVSPTGVALLTKANLEPAIDASMLSWQNQPGCEAPRVTKVAYTGSDPDLIDGIVLGDASRIGTPQADIAQAGWLAREFFDALAPNGSRFILGVTFSFIFVDNGAPTDIDRDGRADVAFREIYYNQRFPWTTDATSTNNIDVQSVATHESGHAYGLGHFGKVFVDSNGAIHYAPRAIMTAVYVSAFRNLTGTDNASFCQLWANAK